MFQASDSYIISNAANEQAHRSFYSAASISSKLMGMQGIGLASTISIKISAGPNKTRPPLLITISAARQRIFAGAREPRSNQGRPFSHT